MNRFVPLLVIACSCQIVAANDWATWRADAERSGFTTDSLPQNLSPHWTWFPQHAPRPAWPRDERISFDRASHAVVAGGLVCFGSSADSTVTALDAETGQQQWKFIAGGPIRFAPTAWKDRMFVTSHDGYLYALQLKTGVLIERWATTTSLVMRAQKITGELGPVAGSMLCP